MTKQEKAIKYYLESYLKAKRQIDKAIEMYARLYATATSTHIYYEGGSGRTPGDVVGNSVCMLDEAKEKIAEKKADAEAIKQHILHLCKFLKSEKTAKIIQMFYLDGLSKVSIADALDCKLSSVSYNIEKGIKEIAKYVEGE